MGRRKEREHGVGWGEGMVCLLSRCSIPFLLGLQSFPLWSLKAGSGLGQSCKALAASVGLWLALSPGP